MLVGVGNGNSSPTHNGAARKEIAEQFTRIEDNRTDIGAGNVAGDADICRGRR